MTIGILPTLGTEHLDSDQLTEDPRYALLNRQMLTARGRALPAGHRRAARGAAPTATRPAPEHLVLDVDSIAPEAACTSLQLHLQLTPEAFPAYWNAAQAVAGVQVALAANSPFLLGRRLWAETRVPLFTQAVDTRPVELRNQGVRPRVWFGDRWASSAYDLFEENVRYFGALLPLAEDEDPFAALDDGPRAGPAGAAPAQRHGLALEPSRLRHRRRRGPPAPGEPGAARGTHGHRRRGQRDVLLRADPGARPRPTARPGS